MLEQQEALMFATRVEDLLKHVEYRRADSPQEKEAIFRLRYEAYARGGYIEPNPSGLFTDAEDECPNAWLIGIFVDGALASSIRLHIASTPEQYIPEAKVFPEIIIPRLEAGQVLISATRQSSNVEFTRVYPFLTYVTMRTVFIAEDYFDGDFVVAGCRPEYRLAFRRLCGFASWAPPRDYPPLTRPQALMGYDCKANASKTRDRYPFVPSSAKLQRALFGRSSNVAHDLHDELTAGHRLQRPEGKQHSATCAA